jgi:hypothetical protein
MSTRTPMLCEMHFVCIQSVTKVKSGLEVFDSNHWFRWKNFKSLLVNNTWHLFITLPVVFYTYYVSSLTITLMVGVIIPGLWVRKLDWVYKWKKLGLQSVLGMHPKLYRYYYKKATSNNYLLKSKPMREDQSELLKSEF